MQKPKDWESVSAYEETKYLQEGGYICEIMNAEETKSKTGKDMLVIAFEIMDGEYKGYFHDLFIKRRDKNPDATWPFEGKKWILLQDAEGNTNRMLKGLVTAIEAENVKVEWGDKFCSSIKGARIGVVFRSEEAEGMVQTYWRAIPSFFCSCEDIRTNNFKTPQPKSLSGTSTRFVEDMPDSFAAAEMDIPF